MGRRSRKRVALPASAELRAAPPEPHRSAPPAPPGDPRGAPPDRGPAPPGGPGDAPPDRAPALAGGVRPTRATAPAAHDERPVAPWHPFPLVELSVLVGIVLIVLGLFVVRGDRGRVLLVFGLALGSLGGLDTALREHFAGFRAHSALLAGVPAVVLAGALAFAGAPRAVVAPAAVVTYAAVFGWARRAFRVRSEGRR